MADLRARTTFAVVLGLCLALVVPAVDASPIKAATMSVRYQQATLSVTAENAPLHALMTDIALQAGIKVTFHEPETRNRAVTQQFSGMPLEQALKRILRDNYVFSFIRQADGSTRLTEVSIGNKSLAPGSSIKSVKIAYGTGKDQLGAIRAGEGAQIGPASFFVGADGQRYFCDTANGRIQVYDANGYWLKSIALKGDSPEDITVDLQGNLYVYDVNGSLYQYRPDGALVGEFAIDETRWQSRGPMHLVGDTLYARVNGSGDFALGTMSNGQWVPNTNTLSDDGVDGVEEGIVGLSGKRYVAQLDRDQRTASISITQNGLAQASLSLPMGNIVSIEFIGEDVQGNFYAKTESLLGERLQIDVSKYSASGAFQGSLTLPGNDYAFWSIKTVTVDASGRIHQMMPGTEDVRFTTYEF